MFSEDPNTLTFYNSGNVLFLVVYLQVSQIYSVAFESFGTQEKTRGQKLFSSQRFFQNKYIDFRTAFTMITWKTTVTPHPRNPSVRNTLWFELF